MMRTKVFLSFIIISLLCACTPGENNDVLSARDVPSVQAAPAIKNTDGFVFEYNGKMIYLDEDMADVKIRLGGEPKIYESPSCAFEGLDLIFTYPGFEIHTYPEGDRDFIHLIYFKDDSITTPEGIYLGSSLEKMISVYGEDFQRDLNQYTYKKGQTFLKFLVTEDGIVDAITYCIEVL